MQEQEIEVTAKLWKGQRWYVDGLGGSLCIDAETGHQIKTHKQVNNPQMISQVQKALGF
jgi:hypothetical protein